jgi:hypothetical protein
MLRIVTACYGFGYGAPFGKGLKINKRFGFAGPAPQVPPLFLPNPVWNPLDAGPAAKHIVGGGMKTLHELVADKLEQAAPQARQALLAIPLDNIGRWLAQGHTAPHRLEQWRQILLRAQASPEGFQELLGLLRDAGEATVQLKSFDPFPGVLTTLERRELLLQCAFAH